MDAFVLSAVKDRAGLANCIDGLVKHCQPKPPRLVIVYQGQDKCSGQEHVTEEKAKETHPQPQRESEPKLPLGLGVCFFLNWGAVIRQITEEIWCKAERRHGYDFPSALIAVFIGLPDIFMLIIQTESKRICF